MENEPDVIRDQMQETRTALTEKLDTLQQKVSDTVENITTPVTETVQSVKEAVSDTVESVKDTVSGAAESVKETLDVQRHVERHPWPMMLGGVAVGFVLGRLLPSPTEVVRAAVSATDSVTTGMSQPTQSHNGARLVAGPQPASTEAGVLGGITEAVQGELGKLTGLGVSLGVGMLRDVVTQATKGEVGDRIKEWMDDLTQKLGGRAFSEPILGMQDRAGTSEQERNAPPCAPHSQGSKRW